MARYYVCGRSGSGTQEDPFRPSLADGLPDGTSWASNQLMQDGQPQPFFLMRVPDSLPVISGGFLVRIERDESTGDVAYYRFNGQVIDADRYDVGSKSVRMSKIGGAMEFVQDWCDVVDAGWPGV
ncbi:MAG: hypothetical protein RQ731_08140 [Anaerosomatales bacterium]|nr:hypothetical protein [Anaerosomatales bacterium]